MKIGPREQLILVSVGLLLVIGVVVGLLVWPQFQKLGVLDTQIATAKQQVASAQSLLAQRQQIKDRAAETEARWLRLSSLVPANPDLPSLIIDLQDTAFASGVQLVSLTPAEPAVVQNATYVRIPLDIKILGTWADTVDFLQQLPKLNRGVRTISFVSSVGGTELADPDLPEYSENTVLSLEAYMIPNATPAAAPAAAQ
jgi:type IV pilus assembly protein PilO